MGSYHNKLDKKYFHKSVYVKKFEEVFNIRIKDYPLQYELLYETYNALIVVNNILFSSNYIPTSQKVNNLIHAIHSYLNKYENKINKCYDSNCIMIYDNLEITLNELQEMKQLYETRGTKYNLKSTEEFYEQYMLVLVAVRFDNLLDSKNMAYIKKANDKLPKKVNLKIMVDIERHDSTLYDIGIQKQLNDNFVSSYSKIKFNLEEDEEQKDFIFETLNRIKDLNNSIVDYYIYKDRTVVDIYNNSLKGYIDNVDETLIKDIEFVNVFHRLIKVNEFINDDKIDLAFDIIKDLITQYSNMYERVS